MRSLEEISFTDSFVGSPARADLKAVSRSQGKDMIEMLADIVRQRKREELRSCLAICISVDDKSDLVARGVQVLLDLAMLRYCNNVMLSVGTVG